MSGIEKSLKIKMQADLFHRGISAAVPFTFFGIIVAFYHFDIQDDLIVPYCALSILASIIRVYISDQISKALVTPENGIKIINSCIVVNSLSWCLLLTTFFSNLPVGSFDSFIVLFLVVGFTNASVVTLASNLSLAIPFQWMMIFPPLTSYYLDYRITHDKSSLQLSVLLIVYAFYLAIQTVSSRKQMKSKAEAEIQLKQSVELLNLTNDKLMAETTRSENASRLAALGQMAGGIAHEINNPLAIISMSVELAQGHLLSSADNKEQIKKNLRVATTAINRIVEIIKSLKLISNSGHQDVSSIPLDSILMDSLNLSREKFKNANIAIQVEKIPNVFVNANLIQVSQVLLNLLNNCFDSTLEIEAQKRYVKISFGEKDDFVLISVENSGKAIEPENVSKLFQPFYTTKDVGRGTGLGLSLCKSIIESLDGKIWFEANRPNTTFTFSLPKSLNQNQ